MLAECSACATEVWPFVLTLLFGILLGKICYVKPTDSPNRSPAGSSSTDSSSDRTSIVPPREVGRGLPKTQASGRRQGGKCPLGFSSTTPNSTPPVTPVSLPENQGTSSEEAEMRKAMTIKCPFLSGNDAGQKVMVLTGASRGIGHGTSKLFAGGRARDAARKQARAQAHPHTRTQACQPACPHACTRKRACARIARTR